MSTWRALDEPEGPLGSAARAFCPWKQSGCRAMHRADGYNRRVKGMGILGVLL